MLQSLPVHELNAVVQVGHAGHANRLGQPVLAAEPQVKEAPYLGPVTRLLSILATNIVYSIINRQLDPPGIV